MVIMVRSYKGYILVDFLLSGISTAKNAANQLDIHLLNTLNYMLSKQNNSTMKSGAPVCSSQLNLDLLHSAIKEAYFQLDKALRKVVKDDSGCVCVSISSSERILFDRCL